MSNAITMGIFWHLIGAASAACFYAPVQASETVVMGNHVVSGRHRLMAYSAVDN